MTKPHGDRALTGGSYEGTSERVVAGRPLPLAAGRIDAWRVELEQPDEVVAALGRVLSPDETARATRFVFARDRRRFVVTRASLRVLLGRHLDVPARAIRFAYAAHGKPALAPGSTGAPLHFNVSHSQELALIALAPDAPLGVDVEAVREMRDLADIAARYFTAAEAETIASVPPDERTLAFFLCWTRKEAFAKALGDGLTLALDRYRVACRPGDPARILEIDGDPAAAAAWSVCDLRPAPGFVGAAVGAAIGAAGGDGAARSVHLVQLDVERDVLPWLGD